MPRKEIVRDAVGVVEQRALDGTTAERGARIPLQRKVGFAGAVRREKPIRRARDAATEVMPLDA